MATDVPVILASRYEEDTVMAGDHPELPQAVLNKPYSMAALKDVLMIIRSWRAWTYTKTLPEFGFKTQKIVVLMGQ